MTARQLARRELLPRCTALDATPCVSGTLPRSIVARSASLLCASLMRHDRNEGSPTVDPVKVVEALEMRADGSIGHAGVVCDLFIGAAVCDQSDNRELLVRQLRGRP